MERLLRSIKRFNTNLLDSGLRVDSPPVTVLDDSNQAPMVDDSNELLLPDPPADSESAASEVMLSDRAPMLDDSDERPLPDPAANWVSTTNEAMLLERILAGDEIVVSHVGASQYTTPGEGVSACGIAALNSVKVVFEKERNGLHGNALLENLMSRDTAEEIMSICALWSSKSHLEVDGIYKIPLFERSLNRVDSRFSQSTLEQFQEILSILQTVPANEKSSAIVITRPPEIITCLKINTDTLPVFVVFDSHPRPKHPTGAGFIFNNSLDAAANHLHELLSIDSALLAVRDMQWQADLLGNFSADVFVPREPPIALNISEFILESSLDLLVLKNQLAVVQNENNSVNLANSQLEREINVLKDDLREARRQVYNRENNDFGWIGTLGEYLPQRESTQSAGSSQWEAREMHDAFPPLPASSRNSPRKLRKEDKNRVPPQSARQNKETARGKVPASKRIPEEDDPDLAIILQLSRDFEEEDQILRQEREALARFQQVVFDCGICLENMPIEDIARIDDCDHAYCRDCLRTYILVKVKDHRYPMICPTCAADTKSKRKPGEVSQFVIQNIGIPDKDYALFEELQLTAFSIFVSCRSCQRTSFVDKAEYQEASIVTCPLPDCQYMWCKQCQQQTFLGGPVHSCDGTNEFNDLVQKEGWKACPGCKTTIQKSTGCNHMTCTSPGCNMHFCYLCGDSIVQSSLLSDIETAMHTHYSKCTLFETYS